jgi:NADPH-dependent curcumin reductase CurA
MVVLGAAGGTGVVVCELGRLLGLHAIACASSNDKLAFALDGAASVVAAIQTRCVRFVWSMMPHGPQPSSALQL